jgi:two-component system OmpR family sensor kinase
MSRRAIECLGGKITVGASTLGGATSEIILPFTQAK